MKIAVVGLGAIGSQVLWQLSRIPGVDAHGFDTAYPGHPGAGSGGDSRLFWNLELSALAYLPLVRHAGDVWRELEEASGVTLRDRTGVLIYGSAGTDQMRCALESAELSRVPVDVLDAAQLRKRFPGFRFDDDAIGAWDLRGAVIRPERTVAVAAALAEQAGARVHAFARVCDVVSRSGEVALVLDDRTERFDRVVVACGGWTPRLLPAVRDEVVAKRLTSLWFGARNEQLIARLPPFLRAAPNYCYGIPSRDGQTLKVGLGFNQHMSTGDPDALDRHLSGSDLEQQLRTFAWIQRSMLPGLDERPTRADTYVESYSRSMLEYVRPHPDDPNILVMTGFSGHGFRVAPAMGQVGAQLVTEGRSEVDVDFLAAASEVFDIVDADRGLTTHNAVMASGSGTTS